MLPGPGEDNVIVIITEHIIWVAIFFLLFLTAAFDIYLIWYDDDVKWIIKEVESLKALQYDYDKLLKLRDEVESRAHSFWHSELKLQQPLSDAETQWVKSIKKVVQEADRCTANYAKQDTGIIHAYTALIRAMPIIKVVHHVGEVRRKIEDHFGKKSSYTKNIYQSMNSSRKKYRMLLDRNKIPENKEERLELVTPPPPKSSKSISDLVTKRKDLISGMEERHYIYRLLLLQVFLRDLNLLPLETVTEKHWKAEAEKLIAEAEVVVDKFLWWVSILNKIRILISGIIKPIFFWIKPMATIFFWNKPVAKIFLWIKPMAPIFFLIKPTVAILFWIKPMAMIFSWIKPMATMRFKGHMKRVFTEFDKLVERKQRYGFDYIDREADSLIFPSTCQKIDDNATPSTQGNIRSKLQEFSNQVKEMRDELHKREETDWRIACLKLTECLLSEARQSLDNFLEGYNSVLQLKHFEQIKEALRKTIDVCNTNPNSVAGFQSDIRNLILKLTANGDDQSIISIVGMAGIGKTALANEIFDKKTVASHFPMRAWVQVSQNAYKTKIMLIRDDGSRELLFLTNVGDRLKEKPCLVVLDDVSSEESWDTLQPILSELEKGSKVLLTTRCKKVALHADRYSTLHELRLQTRGESWCLLKMVTSGIQLDPDMEKLARKVVGRCGGLPLAILSLGCLLSAKDVTKEHLLRALDEINQGQNQKPWQQVWTNFRGLNGTLKNCLHSFTLFPVDYEIPARRLVAIWVAEELVQQKAEFNVRKETPEDAAEQCLEELRNCYMIQAVQLKSNGKIKTCRLPSVLREFIERHGNQTSRDQYYETHLQRRFAYHVYDQGVDPNLADVFSKKGIPISILFFDNREGNKPGQRTRNILSKGITNNQFMEIRVLDLERVFRPQLPEAVSKLIFLRYLGLRWTCIEAIPSFIGKLVSLETLDVKHTCIRTLPSSIWKLKKLRNLYLNQSYRSKLEGILSSNFLESLEMLWGVYIDESSPLLHELHRLKKLKKLKLAFQLKHREQAVLVNQIVKLDLLQSLRLRSIDEMGEVKYLRLENMSMLEQLSSLHLFGNLEDGLRRRNPLSHSLPQSLTDLTLSASKLSKDPMRELENQPNIKSLCFYAESYTGKNMACSRGSFQKLIVLRFRKLKDLENWDAEEGAMPNLVELEIRSCEKLEFPEGLKHLKTLHTVKILDMPKKFKEATERNKRPFWDISDSFDV